MTEWNLALSLLESSPHVPIMFNDELPKEETCRSCKQVKPASEFWTRTYKNGKISLHKECKACKKLRVRRNYAAC